MAYRKDDSDKWGWIEYEIGTRKYTNFKAGSGTKDKETLNKTRYENALAVSFYVLNRQTVHGPSLMDMYEGSKKAFEKFRKEWDTLKKGIRDNSK